MTKERRDSHHSLAAASLCDDIEHQYQNLTLKLLAAEACADAAAPARAQRANFISHSRASHDPHAVMHSASQRRSPACNMQVVLTIDREIECQNARMGGRGSLLISYCHIALSSTRPVFDADAFSGDEA